MGLQKKVDSQAKHADIKLLHLDKDMQYIREPYIDGVEVILQFHRRTGLEMVQRLGKSLYRRHLIRAMED